MAPIGAYEKMIGECYYAFFFKSFGRLETTSLTTMAANGPTVHRLGIDEIVVE